MASVRPECRSARDTEFPWSLQLHASYFLGLSSQDAFLSVTGETAKVFNLGESGTLKIGAALSWTYRIPTQAISNNVPQLYEHMLLSIGPTIEWVGSLGRLRLFIPTRLWIDFEYSVRINSTTGQPVINPNTGNPIIDPGYPSEWPIVPGFSLSWTVLL